MENRGVEAREDGSLVAAQKALRNDTISMPEYANALLHVAAWCQSIIAEKDHRESEDQSRGAILHTNPPPGGVTGPAPPGLFFRED